MSYRQARASFCAQDGESDDIGLYDPNEEKCWFSSWAPEEFASLSRKLSCNVEEEQKNQPAWIQGDM